MIITISGTAGSGKNTVAEMLSEKLKYKYYVMGDLRRKMALDKGITLEELNELAKTDPKSDHEVDEFQAKLGKEEDNLVIVGRTSYHFIPHSFKIFLKVTVEEGARRILSCSRDEENFENLEEAKKSIIKRQEMDEARYKQYYNINPYDESQYDLVIDTTTIPAVEVVELILKKLNK